MNVFDLLVMSMQLAPTSQVHMYADATLSSMAMVSIA